MTKLQKQDLLAAIVKVRADHPGYNRTQVFEAALESLYADTPPPIKSNSSAVCRYWHRAFPKAKPEPKPEAGPRPKPVPVQPNNEISVLCPCCKTLIQVRWSKV